MFFWPILHNHLADFKATVCVWKPVDAAVPKKAHKRVKPSCCVSMLLLADLRII